MERLISKFVLIVFLLLVLTACASVPRATDLYSETYNKHMELIREAQKVLKSITAVGGLDSGDKYFSPKYIDPYKSPLYMEGEIRLLQPARSVKISKNFVSDKKGYTLSNDSKDNVWWRSNAKGYELIIYGFYSKPRDIMSQFNPEKAQLIFSDKDGNKVVSETGKLTVEEFINFNFSKESVGKHFGEFPYLKK